MSCPRHILLATLLAAGFGCTDLERSPSSAPPLDQGAGARPQSTVRAPSDDGFVGKAKPLAVPEIPLDPSPATDRGQIIPGADGHPSTPAWDVPRNDAAPLPDGAMPSATGDNGATDAPNSAPSKPDIPAPNEAPAPSDVFQTPSAQPQPQRFDHAAGGNRVGNGGDAATSGSGTDPDGEIALNLRAKLMADESLSLSAKYVAIDAHDGVVVLRGNVLSDDERHVIEGKARLVNGVHEVDDQLRVIWH